ncbi:MAG TPA: adenylate/guanylate cyclase domain-containing protein [Alphaproteobacteria bacterium]
MHLTRRIDLWLALTVLGIALIARLVDPGLLWTLRNDVFDVYQEWRPRPDRASPLRIVDIDDRSLARLGPWPWPRARIADLVTRLSEMGTAVIALDLLFPQSDPASPGVANGRGAALEDALRAAGNVVAGFAETGQALESAPPATKAGLASLGDDPIPFLVPIAGTTGNLAIVEAAAQGNGLISAIPDRDGLVRRMPLLVSYRGEAYPALAAEVLRVAQGATGYIVRARGASRTVGLGSQSGISDIRIGAVAVPTDPEGRLVIHFARPDGTRVIPAWAVLEGRVPEAELRNTIAIVGGSAAELASARPTPVTTAMSLAAIHAQAIDQILAESWLRRPDWAIAAEMLFILVLGVGVIVLSMRRGAIVSALVGGAGIAAAGAFSWYAYAAQGLLFDPVTPGLMVAAVYLVFSVTGHLRVEGQRKLVKQAFSSYMSPNLVEHFIDNPSSLRLGGERRECSFVLTDLAGFTSLVESAEAAVVAKLLNAYVDGLTRIALAHQGTLDRVVGDAVAVLFSAPVVQPDHALRAIACALEMDAFSRALQAEQQRLGLAVGRTRIGVNTGDVLIGNVGGDAHSDYRALGDAINTAARLEAANKRLGTNVCVSAATAERCPDLERRPIGTLRLAGKRETVDAYEPLANGSLSVAPIAAYREAFAHLDSDRDRALAAFDALAAAYPSDALVRFHRDRLRRGETGQVIDLQGG